MKRMLTSMLLIFSMSSSAGVDFFKLRKVGGETLKITSNDMGIFPPENITTSTNFTDKADFVGVKFEDLMRFYNLSGSKVRAFALDGYSFSMSTDEMIKYGVIIAYKMNGENFPVSGLGPFAIIYPRDKFPELNNLSVNAKTVWQLKMLEIK